MRVFQAWMAFLAIQARVAVVEAAPRARQVARAPAVAAEVLADAAATVDQGARPVERALH
jgi:hypothetical protein